MTRISRLLWAPSLVALLTAAMLPASAMGAGEVECWNDPPSIVGTEGRDLLVGTDGPDIIAGLGGNDTIYGLGGDDHRCPESNRATDGSNDLVYGGPGNDVIGPLFGFDTAYGGRAMTISRVLPTPTRFSEGAGTTSSMQPIRMTTCRGAPATTG